jgi:two-component system response regulator NreC
VSPIRIVLAEDHRVVRAGLRLLLNAEEGLEVVAETGDVDGMLRVVLGYKPDVLVLALTMPGTLTPLEALPHVRERCANTATVVLTMHDDPAIARRAFRGGALGYVLKSATGEDFIEAIRRAAIGEVSLSGAMGAKLAVLPETPPAPDNLSDREVAVLHLIALGHTNAEIGEQLFLSVRTVETHRANLQHKLGRSTRAALVSYALSHGGISEG